MRRHPHLYEINARLWLRRLSEREGRRVTLAAVPDRDLRAIRGRGLDLLWLMGAWARSPGARDKALSSPDMRRAYDAALPGWTEADVSGSPYAVLKYELDPALGSPEELAAFRDKVHRAGLGLLLDFVPNHLAIDHGWTLEHPERFVRAPESEAQRHPDWFFKTANGDRIAHGRDPNFPPWTDTAQVNFFSSELRGAHAEILAGIARVADGARCDMAMLALNRVFGGIWDRCLPGPAPREEYWPPLIARVRGVRPDFLFLAESYWGLEWDLQEAGFDFTYDKTLYDRLRYSTPLDVLGHLRAQDLYQRRSARFIENHDEPRARAAFGDDRSLAAAVVMSTVPGLRFFHDGQLEGRKVRLPVQLIREPAEPPEPRWAEFYDRLLASVDAPSVHEGEWSLLEVAAAQEGSLGHRNLLAWSWRLGETLKVVVVNYADAPGRGRVGLGKVLSAAAARFVFRDELAGTERSCDGDETRSRGLRVELGPWAACIFDAAAR